MSAHFSTEIIYPFMPKGTSLSYPFDQPHFRLLGGIFQFRILCMQTVETLIRHHILRHLIWICTVYLCPIKRTISFYGLSELKQNDKIRGYAELLIIFSMFNSFKIEHKC